MNKYRYHKGIGGYHVHVEGVGAIRVKRSLPDLSIGWDARATLWNLDVVGFNTRDQAVDTVVAIVRRRIANALPTNATQGATA